MSTITSVLVTPPLTIPEKKTEPFDWVHHCENLMIRANLPAREFIAEAHELEAMRSRCLGSGANRTGIQLYIIYYQQLSFITNRFIQVDVEDGEVEFTWYIFTINNLKRFDAYDSAFSESQKTVAFEKANILFNCATLISQIAAASPTGTPEEMNGMFAAFQCSASILAYLKEHFLHPPLHDISKPSLEFLTQLMIAQSQEAAARKAVLLNVNGQSGASPKIISRLWRAAALNFASALKFWYAPNAGKVRACVQETVPELIDQKFKLSSALCLYYSAISVSSEDNIGEAIARLNSALKYCHDALESNVVLSNQFRILQNDILSPMRDKLEKENSLIFHQIIPSVIPEIEPANLVSLQSLEQVFDAYLDSPVRDLFSRAIPQHVHKEAERFRQELQKLWNYEEHLVGEAVQLFERIKLNLPEQNSNPFEYLKSQLKLKVQFDAKSIKECASEILQKAFRLKEMLFSDLGNYGKQLKEFNQTAFDCKSGEERRALLERIDVLAAVFESFLDELNAVPLTFNNELKKMEECINQYSNGDFGIDEVQSSFEEPIQVPFIETVSEDHIVCSAKNALDDLKVKVDFFEDISPDLVAAGKTNYDQIINDNLKKFDPLAQKIEEAVEQLRSLTSQLQGKLSEYESFKQSIPAFKHADEQINKRCLLLKVYRQDLSNIR